MGADPIGAFQGGQGNAPMNRLLHSSDEATDRTAYFRPPSRMTAAAQFCACPFRKTGAHFSGTCA